MIILQLFDESSLHNHSRNVVSGMVIQCGGSQSAANAIRTSGFPADIQNFLIGKRIGKAVRAKEQFAPETQLDRGMIRRNLRINTDSPCDEVLLRMMLRLFR